MNKRCTNPNCRKIFSTLQFGGLCPHCGKTYPQLVNLMSEFIPASNQLVNCHVTGFVPERKVLTIKTLRDLCASAEGNSLGLKEAKDIIEGTRCLENVRGSFAWEIRNRMKEIGAEVRITLPSRKEMQAEKKEYPQLGELPLSRQIVDLRVVSFAAPKKVAAVKLLRDLVTDGQGTPLLGLKEAKDIVEGTRRLEKIPRDQAEKIRNRMKEIGAEVRITLPSRKEMQAEKKPDAKEQPDPANKKQAAAIPPEKHGKKAAPSHLHEKSKEEIARENQYRKLVKKVRLKNRGRNPGIPDTTCLASFVRSLISERLSISGFAGACAD